jgi:formylglycine-generating enzyme required for sulfatase activity
MQLFRVVLVVLLLVFGATSFLGMAQSSVNSPTSGNFEPLVGMVLIPAGTFEMGDSFEEGCPDELPVHTVTVSAFYIGRYEVTNDEMVEVLQWAYENDKIEVSVSTVRNAIGDPQKLLHLDEAQCRITWDGRAFVMKSTKASGYPCVEVSWYGALAFCNYRSEMEGLTPCYDLSDWSCNWLANGYRLPTEAEWERAARGGVDGHRFPWSDTDTIQHTRSNYESRSNYSYDTSLTTGDHPDYADGDYPYTSPVGSFAPNGYGLYDMAGNVWEWVWDLWDANYYAVSPKVDPHGPLSTSSLYRVVRSGRWGYDASSCRISGRRHGWPGGRRRMGFRIVLPSGQ